MQSEPMTFHLVLDAERSFWYIAKPDKVGGNIPIIEMAGNNTYMLVSFKGKSNREINKFKNHG